MFRNIRILFAAIGISFVGALFATNVAAQENTKITDDPEIFNQFGGKAGLVKIMDDFMVGLVADPRTGPFFKDIDQKRTKEQLVDQVCEILNGPCKYTGRKMKPLHANLGINREHFNALVEQFQFAMDKNNVPFRAQNKVLAILAPMHRDIINK